MNRRNAITTFSGLAVASLVAARTSRVALAQTGTGPTLGDSEYKLHTLNVGTLSKQMSVMALDQATSPEVKVFAQFETNEQTAIAQVLTGLNSPPPAPLLPPQQAMLTKLQAASGKAFDVAYVAGQIEGHEQLMTIQQSFLNGVPTDHDHEHIAILARTVIQMHLTMLAELQRSLAA